MLVKRVENSNVWIYTDYIIYMYVPLLIGYTIISLQVHHCQIF